ncbi:MAG TPA: squalene/phytoene synthase family protein [Azospirillaceae bacterium]|nr:squalene/phytoene synthase family protein [Azospirillaceae bacterium]
MIGTLATAALVLAALPAAMAALNLILLRTPRPGSVPADARVSILIPARNEEANIAAAVEAALATRGVPFEVVVMDDASTDRTAAIVAGIVARDPGRVRLERAPPLPPGWAGKAHACWSLAQRARGTHLLFIDADVRIGPDAAARLLAQAERTRADFVSGVPRQRTGSLGERLTVPMINTLILGYFPALFMRLSGLPGFGAACGQLMLVRRDAYFAAGGHAAIRGTFHDGLKLCRRMRAAGFRTDLVAGADLATCRMYTGFRDAWHGFGRNAREGMATWAGLPVWTVLLAGGHLLPPALVAASLAGLAPAGEAVTGTTLLALALSLGFRAAVTLRTREDGWTVPLHPAIVATGLAIQWAALLAPGRRRGWKGRAYTAIPGPVDKTAEPASDTRVAPTKDHTGENFPVASRMVAPHLRPAVLAFYRFARAADDIADHPALPPAEKLARLDAMERALAAADPAVPVAADLAAVDRRFGAGAAEARRLLEAFRQDAVKRRYADWAELTAYCERSANPVGRLLLRLHGEDVGAEGPADALCTALQILNHLQDLQRDRAELDRVYLPVPWMERAGGETAFFGPAPNPGRRAILDAALDQVELLIGQAECLPGRLRSRRLAAETATTLALARRLCARLRAADPVERRVALSKADFARAFVAGVRVLAGWRGPTDAAVARAVVVRSGSSFRLGMSRLTAEPCRAIHAVYAFCRLIDDAADGAAPFQEKRRFLDDWRREVERIQTGDPRIPPRTPVGRELAWATRQFGLPVAEFHALLDGMATDAADRVRLDDDAALDLYCRRVAGAVGVLSIRIFGAPEAEAFALGLGRTLQLVNILRDIDEDAGRDRLYVPLSRLAGPDGVPDGPATALVGTARFVEACRWLADEAAAGFDQADRALAGLDRRRLAPAVLMMEAYRQVLHRLRARGWEDRRISARLTRSDKLRLILRTQRGSA